jgi:hypothetical protein
MAEEQQQQYLHRPHARADGREGFLVSPAGDPDFILGWHADPPGNILDRAVQRGSQFPTMTALPVRDRAIAERGTSYVSLPLAEPENRDRTRTAPRVNEPGAGVYHPRGTCPACHLARGRDLDVRLPPVPALGAET